MPESHIFPHALAQRISHDTACICMSSSLFDSSPKVLAPLLNPNGDLLSWFTDACRCFPSRPAIERQGDTVSYSDLARRVKELARFLARCQLERGDVIVLLISDRIELIAAMIAVFQRGCICVPLNPDAPPERARSILADAQPVALLTEPPLRKVAAELHRHSTGSCTVLTLGTDPVVATRNRQVEPLHPDLAYVYYTSGSTGTPKGVMGSLEAVSQFVQWEVEAFALKTGWRIGQFMEPSFDAFLRDVFVPLSIGGTVVLPPAPLAQMTPEEIVTWLGGSAVNLIHTVPSLLAVLTDAAPEAGRLQALHHVFVSGEVLHASVVQRWWDRFGDNATLVNLYGATETTMTKLFHVVHPHDLSRSTIPIGQPMAQAKVHVLDEAMRICPPGVEGELYLGSPYLALGYYRDAPGTRAVYVPDPFSDDPAAVLYRTGDYGLTLENGTLFFKGRKDDLVKVNGVRVVLGEVEIALKQYPGIKEAVVLSHPDTAGTHRLEAYLVAGGTTPIRVKDLRLHLHRYVPPEMIPATFAFLGSLPRTLNGKIDRQQLRTPDSTKPPSSITKEGLRNDVEYMLAAIWCDVLGVDSVSTSDNFFELGGHSLHAMQIASRWRRVTGNALSLSMLFTHPTIAGLAHYLNSGSEQVIAPGAATGKHGADAVSHTSMHPQTSQITLRPARLQDLPNLLPLLAELEVTNDGPTLSETEAREMLEQIEAVESHQIYVAARGNILVGTFALFIVQHLSHGGTRSAVIEDVVVGRDWQGQGIGQAMMAFAAEQARASGCYKVALSSWAGREDAHRFYERLGYQRNGYSFTLALDDMSVS